jgi:hypothetical protein
VLEIAKKNFLWRTTLEQTETESLTLVDSGFVPYNMWCLVAKLVRNRESGQWFELGGEERRELRRNSVND